MRSVAPLVLAIACLTAGSSAAQAPVFDAASIKVSTNRANGNFFEMAPGGRRFTATNESLKLLIVAAYDVNPRYVSGGPAWVGSEPYDVEAETERPASEQEMRLMLQALLDDRFKLRLHKETKEVAIYVLAAEDHLGKIRRSGPQGEPRVRRGGDGQTIFENVSMSQLTGFLSLRLRRDVIDKTGLEGNYDFEIPSTPDVVVRSGGEDAPPPDANGPSVFTALRELGLKLTAGKGTVEVLVVDQAEKPSAN